MAVIPPRHTFAITISTCPARMSVFGGEQATNYSDMMEGPIMQARDFIRSKKLVNTTIFVGQCRLDPAFNPPEEYAQHFLSSADADSKKVAEDLYGLIWLVNRDIKEKLTHQLQDIRTKLMLTSKAVDSVLMPFNTHE